MISNNKLIAKVTYLSFEFHHGQSFPAIRGHLLAIIGWISISEKATFLNAHCYYVEAWRLRFMLTLKHAKKEIVSSKNCAGIINTAHLLIVE